MKITPTSAVPMAGFGNRTQAAQSVSQDLWAKALVLEDPRGHRAVLIMLDLVGIDRATSAAVCATLHKKFGLAREQVCLNCSHTHCGPAVGRLLSGMFFLTEGEWQRVDEYTTQLRGKIIEAVGAALDRLAPATLSWGQGTLDFAVNRRNNPPDRVLELRREGRLKGPSDYDVPVLKVAASDDRLVAVVGLYACHATILAFTQWSGDWPGYGTAELEKAHPGAIAFYCAGCGGDQTPWPRPPETVERTTEYGRRFAKAVEAVLAGPMTSVKGDLATSYREIDLRLADLPPRADLEARTKSANRFEARRARQLLEQLDAGRPPKTSYPYPVQVWRLGTGPRLVALGGEVVVDYALRLKKELGRERTWVAGYSNDVMAYIPSRRVLGEGGYEGGGAMVYYGLPTVWAPRVEEDIVREVLAQVGVAAEKRSGPLSPREEQASFRVPKGFRVELVACEPEVVDPVAMSFDEDGRIFVAEMRGYNGPTAPMDMASGRIRLLEDRDGDGYYEHATTFGRGLRLPSGVTPWNGGVLVVDVPDLTFYKDRDGDGRADLIRVLYTGFGLGEPGSSGSAQGFANTPQWALDNWVYVNASEFGGTLHSLEKRDRPVLKLFGRRGVRFHPEQPGSLEPTSGGGQYGLAADDWQRWFVNTNSVHLMHIILPDHYLARNPLLQVSGVVESIADGKGEHKAPCKLYRISPMEPWRVERSRRNLTGSWRTWTPAQDANKGAKTLHPPTELVGGGYVTSGCSPVVYTADLFPEAYRGNTFICDPANNLVHRDVLEAKGSSFVAHRGEPDCEFLASTDPWFRPVHLSVGPDGGLYVVDFYREVIEDLPDIPEDLRKSVIGGSCGRGRIWRVVPEGTPRAKKPALRKAPSAVLVQQLNNANAWWRLTAQRLLMERLDKTAVPQLAELARKASLPVGRAHALWALQGLGSLDDGLIEHALKDTSAGVREQALRLVEPRLAANTRLRAAVLALADDPEPRVRFQLAFTLGEIDDSKALAGLARIARRDAADPGTRMAILSSVSRTAPTLLETLARDAEFTRSAAAGQKLLLTRLAALVGARASAEDVARVLRLLAGPGNGAGWQIAVLEGLGQGSQNSKLALGRLWDQPPPALKESMEQARPFFTRAATTAGDDKRSLGERITAIQLLGYGPFATSAPVLQGLLAPQQPADIQMSAVRALALQENSRVTDMLLASWGSFTPAIRREVLEALFARVGRLLDLLTAIEQNKLAVADLEPSRIEQLRKHSNPKVRQRAEALLRVATPDRKKVMEAYRSALDLEPVAARGKAIFQKVCATCHRLDNMGVEVGPDLVAALSNKTPEKLLTDILDPSREVDSRYVNYLVTLKNGRGLSGLIAAETASSITLRRAERAEDTVLRTQIEEVHSTGKSIMPDGLEAQLSKQDLADVIGYLLRATAK
ncbi:MAG TPA: neutral/alkaline non-lysosomal ceramidase N-terminal domain-containing protein [Gemmataceae bacterium]